MYVMSCKFPVDQSIDKPDDDADVESVSVYVMSCKFPVDQSIDRPDDDANTASLCLWNSIFDDVTELRF